MRGTRQDKKLQALKNVPLFGGMSKRDLTEVARIADELDFSAGKELIRENEPGRQFFVLLEGEAVVRRRGRKVNTLGPGDFFGEIALLSERPTTATVVTTDPFSRPDHHTGELGPTDPYVSPGSAEGAQGAGRTGSRRIARE